MAICPRFFFVRKINYFTLTLFIVVFIYTIILFFVTSIKKPNKYLLIFFTPALILIFESIFYENTLFSIGHKLRFAHPLCN